MQAASTFVAKELPARRAGALMCHAVTSNAGRRDFLGSVGHRDQPRTAWIGRTPRNAGDLMTWTIARTPRKVKILSVRSRFAHLLTCTHAGLHLWALAAMLRTGPGTMLQPGTICAGPSWASWRPASLACQWQVHSDSSRSLSPGRNMHYGHLVLGLPTSIIN